MKTKPFHSQFLLCVAMLMLAAVVPAIPLQAAESERADSLFAVGCEAHLLGDYETALPLLKEAVAEGHSEAKVQLGVLYIEYYKDDAYIEKAIKLFEESADEGEFRAFIVLGECYKSGIGVPVDALKSAEFLKKGFELVSHDYWFNYSYLFLDKDIELATDMYELLVDAGYVAAYKALALIYLSQDEEQKAVELLKKGSDEGDAEAKVFLARCYLNGIGVEKDDFIAECLLRELADAGDSDGQASLGLLYFSEGNFDEAFVLFSKAAEQGEVESLLNLGLFYYLGVVVEKDYSKAIEYFKKAMDSDVADAFYYMGRCYEEGKGVECSLTEATRYYRLAADKGCVEAKVLLDSGVN